MSEAAVQPVETRARDTRGVWPGLAIVAGAAVFIAVLSRPALDGTWENHAAHFWIVLIAAALNVALGYAVGVAASRRRDARLFLVALAFVSAAAFLGLHALATPGVLIGKNAGFELATPVGLALAGAFAAASGPTCSSASSSTAGRSHWPSSASFSTPPRRSATSGSTEAGARVFCSSSRWRSACSPRRCS